MPTVILCDRCGRIIEPNDVYLKVVAEKHSQSFGKDMLLSARYSIAPPRALCFCGDCIQEFVGGTRLDQK